MRSVDSSVIKHKAKIFAVDSTTCKDPNSHTGEGKSELKSAESMDCPNVVNTRWKCQPNCFVLSHLGRFPRKELEQVSLVLARRRCYCLLSTMKNVSTIQIHKSINLNNQSELF